MISKQEIRIGKLLINDWLMISNIKKKIRIEKSLVNDWGISSK